MDHFHDTEREIERRFTAGRDRFFMPVIKILIKAGVQPNLISALGVLFLLAACLQPAEYFYLTIVLLILYILCDGLDGPLARAMDRAHEGGSLVDILADHAGVIFVPAASIYHLGARGEAALVFSSVYLVFIGLVLYANELGVSLKRFFRLKYILYLLYVLSLILKKDLVSYLYIVLGIYYMVEIIDVLRRIYRFFEERY